MKNFSLEQIKAVQDLYEVLQNDSLKERQYDKSKVEEGRSEYARDYARILYSSSFRRLQGKMQILGIESTAFYRNRLTHSLEVSQIARSIARTLAFKCNKENYLEEELYLLDAAALGHDIGHPAFGHKGERVLDEIAKVYELRFEGNAQNFRVLRKLDRHGSSPEGLDLTYRTLLAINKYIEKEGKETKKFMYNEDYEFLEKFRQENELENQRTLDVQIIELADDIAYAVHDLEDGLSQGLFSIDELCFEILSYNNEKMEQTQIKNAYDEFKNIVTEIQNKLNDVSNNIKTIQEYSHLFRKNLTSSLTDKFVRSLSFDENKKELCIEEPYGTLCKILSKIIFICVSRNSEVALYETKGEIVLKTLFNIYVDEKINKNYYLLPPDYRPKNKEIKTIVRCVLDYLAGMMDTYAISEYERLTGESFYNMNINNIPEIKKWSLK